MLGNLLLWHRPFTWEKAYIICTTLLFFTVPLSSALPNILIAPIGFIWLVRFRESIKKLNTFQKGIISLFIILMVLAVFSGDALSDSKTLSKYGLIIALFIFLQPIKNRILQENAFMIGLGLAVLTSVYKGIVKAQGMQQISLGEIFGNSSFLNDVLLWDRPYFGFLLLLVAHICINRYEVNLQKKSLMIAFTTSVVIFVLAARLSMLLCTVLWIIYAIRRYTRFSKKQWIYTSIISICLLTLLVSNNGFWQRFQARSTLEWNTERMLDIEPRYVIWPCAIDIFQEKGSSKLSYRSKKKIDQSLVDCYASTIDKKSKKEWYFLKGFNTHNQFLNMTLRGGLLLGIAFFLIFVWGMTIESTVTSYISLIFIFFCFLMLENVIDRQLGAIIFGVFLSYIPFKNKKIKKI